MEIGWHERPNRRRNGWSGVSYLELALPAGGSVSVFIKRQENHTRRTFLHPLTGVTTYEQELRNIRLYEACGVPSLEAVYFAKCKVDGNLCAIIITKALSSYLSLEDLVRRWKQKGWPVLKHRITIINELAKFLENIHKHRLQHSSMYPKHLFVHGALVSAAWGDDEIDIRIIDLESTRRRLFMRQAMLRDLDSLNRYSPEWSRTDRLRFLKAYLGIVRLTPAAKRICRKLIRMAETKTRTRPPGS